MPDQETIQQQQDLLAQHRQRLTLLLEQQAQFGIHVPPYIVIDIREAQAALRRIKAWLREVGVPVADEPNDEVQVVADSLPLARHQLRAPVGDFVGRTSEIAELIAALHQATDIGGVAAITSVQGMGGIGKTELAYVVAQHVRDTFSDGQIVLPLRGSSATPMRPEQALQTIIRAFTPNSQLPDDLAALESLYRTHLHAKRVLILADDAHDAAQVRPLLPPPGCALLVTSRLRFTLPAMTTIDLEQLPPVEASHLLRAICPRLTEDEAAALAHACSYLPLALRVSGSLLRNTPALTVADYLAQLTDERQRLTSLRDPDDPQLDVAAVLTLSYAQLDPTAQAVFQQLGTLVADFATTLALSVVRIPDDGDVTATLHVLLRRNLVIYDVTRQRWRLHDLVRDAARLQLKAAGEAEAVEWRYAHAALQIAAQSQDQYRAGGEQTLLGLSLFDAERAHIDAARHWAQRHTQTPEGDRLLINAALVTRYFEEIRYDWRQENIPMWESVRIAAQRLGDRFEEGRALNNLGNVYHNLGELHTAISYYEQALVIVRELGDRRIEGNALGNLGNAYYSLGELHTAISYYEQQLAITREIGDRRGESNALGNTGIAYYDLGEPAKAINYCEQQLTIAREIGDRRSEAMALGNFSIAYLALDKPAKATSYGEQQLAIAHEIGDRQGEGKAFGNLGSTYLALGDPRRAIDAFEKSLIIARAIGDRRMEGYGLSYLSRAQAMQGDMAQATTTFAQAIALFRETDNRTGLAECQWYFGLALTQHGEQERALPLLRAAVAYEQEIKHAKAEEHTALVARLEAGEDLPPELYVPKAQRAIEDAEVAFTEDNSQL